MILRKDEVEKLPPNERANLIDQELDDCINILETTGEYLRTTDPNKWDMDQEDKIGDMLDQISMRLWEVQTAADLNSRDYLHLLQEKQTK